MIQVNKGIQVKIGKFMSKRRNKRGWDVAVIIKTKNYSMMSYQGRFINYAKAQARKLQLEREIKHMLVELATQNKNNEG